MARKKKEIKVPSKYVNTNPNIMKNSPVEQYVLKAVDLLKEGLSHSAIKEIILADKKKGSQSPEVVQGILSEALNRIKVEFAKDRKHISALHTARYDRQLKKFLNVDVSKYKATEARQIKINAYLAALETLFRKEKLLQIHTKSFQIKVNNTLNAKVTERKVHFDLTNLTLQEKIDFLNLITKSKRNSTENSSVILTPKVEKEETIDIEHEEVKVAQLQTYKPEVVKEEQTPVPTLLSIQQKLADALKRKAEEEFKKKGAKV